MFRVSDFMAAYRKGRSLTRQITDGLEMARNLLMCDIQCCNPFQSDSVSLIRLLLIWVFIWPEIATNHSGYPCFMCVSRDNIIIIGSPIMPQQS